LNDFSIIPETVDMTNRCLLEDLSTRLAEIATATDN